MASRTSRGGDYGLGGERPYRRHCRTCVGDRRCAPVGRAAQVCWISLRGSGRVRARGGGEDPTGYAVGLASEIGGVPLLAAQLSFAGSRYGQLQAYDRGYVKEGVGAGGCAIASGLAANWTPIQLLQAVEALASRCESEIPKLNGVPL